MASSVEVPNSGPRSPTEGSPARSVAAKETLGTSPMPARRPNRTSSRSASRSLSVSRSPPEISEGRKGVEFSVRGGHSDESRRGRAPASSRDRAAHPGFQRSPSGSLSPIWNLNQSADSDETRRNRSRDPNDKNDRQGGRGSRSDRRRSRLDGERDRGRGRSRSRSASPKYGRSKDYSWKRRTSCSPALDDPEQIVESRSVGYRSFRRPRSRSPGVVAESPPSRRRRYLSPAPRWKSRAYVESHGHRYRRSSPPYRDRDSDFKNGADEGADVKRDARTIFVWQLAQRVDEQDVRDFFSRAGRIRDVRLIIDRRSGRHKGQGYVEFFHARSVPTSIAFNGEALCGFPVAVKSIGADVGDLPAGLAKYSSAVPVEIPQLPPPPMPEKSLPRSQVQVSSGQFSLPLNRERTGKPYDPDARTAPTSGPETANTRLVSVEELAVLLNPHGLPIVAAPAVPVGSVPDGSANTSKEVAISSISLPESQQVPLPIPGRLTATPPVGPPAPVSAQFKRLYVGSIPFTVSEDDLMTIFSPFGEILSLQLQREAGTGRSRGYGFVEFASHESAKKALDLNGLVLAGRSLKVNLASATNTPSASLPSLPQGSTVPLPGPAGRSTAELSNLGDQSGELDDGHDGGLAMNASQRALLMQRLSRGEDMGTAAKSMVEHSTRGERLRDAQLPAISYSAPCLTTAEASRCLLLSNMFDPVTELKSNLNFELEVAEDVRDEVSTKYGPVKHLYVDKLSRGLVYITLDSVATSSAAKAGLNGRWFGGNRVTAEFVNEHEYKKRNPEAVI